MPNRMVDAVFFIGMVPIIRYEDGLFKIGYNIGKQAFFEIVMRPKIFTDAMLLANEEMAKCRLESVGSNVAQFGRKKG